MLNGVTYHMYGKYVTVGCEIILYDNKHRILDTADPDGWKDALLWAAILLGDIWGDSLLQNDGVDQFQPFNIKKKWDSSDQLFSLDPSGEKVNPVDTYWPFN